MAKRQNKIIELELEKEVMKVLEANPKASFSSIADYLNAYQQGKGKTGKKYEISRKTVERYIKANEEKVYKVATSNQNQLIAVSLENQVKIEEKIVKLLDEAHEFYEDLKIRESDSSAVRQFKNILDVLKFAAKLMGRIQESTSSQTNIYNVNFAPSVNNYLLDLKNKKKLICNQCKSTDISVKE